MWTYPGSIQNSSDGFELPNRGLSVDERNTSRAWLRLAGLGFELAASTAGGALLGWWIDRQLGSSPKALITLAAVGILGGLYNLIRTALAASREAAGPKDEGPGGASG